MRGSRVAAGVGALLCATTVLRVPSAAADGTSGTGATVAGLPGFVVDAHRGGGLEAREDSLSGLQSAYASGLVQVLDVDTRMLADGTVVLMHDATVDRASSSSGPVSGFTADTWSGVRLDLGGWLTPAPEPEPAATLAEVLDRFGGRIVLSIEAKDSRSLDQVAEMVRARGLADSVYVNTNVPAVAQRIHDLGLRTQLWRSAAQMRTDDPRAFAPYVDLLDVDTFASDEEISSFAASGVPRLWVHTVTTRAEVDRARRLGARGVVTDDPRYVSGTTDAYPSAPTVVALTAAPAPAQVSDPTHASVGVSAESGPGIPGADVEASGNGLLARVVAGPGGSRRLTLDTRGAHAGPNRLHVSVPSGRDDERVWGAAATDVTVPLTGEDLALREYLRVDRRSVTAAITLLDSAADGYPGPRPETGQSRTVAGLAHARVRVTVSRDGRTVFAVRLTGQDNGASRTDGIGTLRLTWHGRRAGSVVVAVRQSSSTYRSVVTRRRVRLR